MRILIQNYTSMLSTEAMYLAKSLELAGQDVYLWQDPNISAFDMFDQFKPDVVLTHYQFLSNDMIKYLSQKRQIQCVLNVTGINNENMGMIDDSFGEKKINCPFVFTNAHNILPTPVAKKIKINSILPGLDIFLPEGDYPEYKLDLGVIATDANEQIDEYVENKDTYHLLKLATAPEKDKNFDMPVNILSLRGMYSRYKEIMFATGMNIIFSQLFYEAIAHSDKVTFKLEKDEEPILDKFLASTFIEEESDNLGAVLKKQIRSRHNCVSRAARFCKFIKNSDAQSKLEKLKGEL